MKYTLRSSAVTVHWGYFDPALDPVLKVRSGDTVEVYTISSVCMNSELIDFLGIEDKIPKEVKEIDQAVKERGPGRSILLGPIYVEEATTADTLEVALLEIEPWVDFGINTFYQGGGSIPEDFPYLRARYIPIDRERMLGIFSEVKIPLRPFFGQLGVAPSIRPGRISNGPPGPHGGNMDNKELVASSKVYLPIHTNGALFSVGDGHSTQGDGEVDQAAMETCMRGLLKFRVIKGVRIRWPMAETKEHFIVMGFHPDLDEALKMAVRNTVDFFVSKGINRDDGYMFCSLAVDFHITQVVDGVKGVHAMIPKYLLPRIRSVV